MSERRRRSGAEPRGNDHHNDIMLRPMEKNGDKVLEALYAGKMVAILSGMEIMYVFVFREEFQCFIHEFDAEEGRRKSWPKNEFATAMLKNLPSAADQIFEITPRPDMHYMGVMVAAERGILSYLQHTGQTPAEDMDFMDWKDNPKNENQSQEAGV